MVTAKTDKFRNFEALHSKILKIDLDFICNLVVLMLMTCENFKLYEAFSKMLTFQFLDHNSKYNPNFKKNFQYQSTKKIKV